MNKEKLVRIDALKKEIDAYRPFSQQTLESLKAYFLVGLTYSSNALEGNSLTETETKVIIEDGLTVSGKPLREHLEVLGHAQAYNFMCEQLATKKNIVLDNVLQLHRLFYRAIDEKQAGTLRTKGIVVTGTDYDFPKPAQLATCMKQFIEKITLWQNTLHPVQCAAYAHLELVTIHPFVDGNGRTARLLMNVILAQNGYPITIIPPVLRMQYIAALRVSNNGNSEPFFDLIADVVYESCKEYIRLLGNLE